MLVALVLALIAAATGWMLFRDFKQARPDRFSGPSRPSYELIDFELNAFDEQGRIAFRAKAPRLLHGLRFGQAVTTAVFSECCFLRFGEADGEHGASRIT